MTYWMDRNIKFGREKENRHHFVETTKASSINLAIVQCACLQELLEHDAVLAVFARCNLDSMLAQFLANSGMT